MHQIPHTKSPTKAEKNPIMSIHKIFFLTLIFSSTFLYSPSLSELCHPNDKKALLQIKKAFNNPYVLTSWKPNTDCCEWYVVKCGGGHRVVSFEAFSGGLSGPIPPQIGDLPYLENIDLRKQPNLTGPIPKEIAKLQKLSSLRMDWNSLSGPVPDFLSQLRNLDYLDLSFNKLSGTIPSSLAKLPKLSYLRLDRNRLTGPIPDSFGEFPALTNLVLSHNQLSGKIPASMGKKGYRDIDLSWNKLSGDASLLFGPGRAAESVDLSRNSLEFDLSKVKYFQKGLTRLDLSHNKIFGSLPPDLTKLSLQHLNVSYNRLCGRIPVGGQLQGFGPAEYFNNRCLCGAPLPKCK